MKVAVRESQGPDYPKLTAKGKDRVLGDLQIILAEGELRPVSGDKDGR